MWVCRCRVRVDGGADSLIVPRKSCARRRWPVVPVPVALTALIALGVVGGCALSTIITGGVFLDRLQGTAYNQLLRREVDHEITLRSVGEEGLLLRVGDGLGSRLVSYHLKPTHLDVVVPCVAKYFEWEARATRRGDMINKEICYVFVDPYLKLGGEWHSASGLLALHFVSESPRHHRLVVRFDEVRSSNFIRYKPDDLYMTKATAARFRELLTPSGRAAKLAEHARQRALEAEYR